MTTAGYFQTLRRRITANELGKAKAQKISTDENGDVFSFPDGSVGRLLKSGRPMASPKHPLEAVISFSRKSTPPYRRHSTASSSRSGLKLEPTQCSRLPRR